MASPVTFDEKLIKYFFNLDLKCLFLKDYDSINFYCLVEKFNKLAKHKLNLNKKNQLFY